MCCHACARNARDAATSRSVRVRNARSTEAFFLVDAAKVNLMSDQIESQIIALIASTLHLDATAIRRDTSIAGAIGADSLNFVVLILAIEDEFQVDIPDEDAAEILTVAQLIEYVTFAQAIKETAASRPNLGRRVALR
jgi:acyl carrier protein